MYDKATMEYTTLATDESIKKASEALKERGFHAEVVATKEEALEKIKSLIPAGATVMNGASVTLQEIGYMDYLKSGEHPWKDLHAAVIAEADPPKRADLRKQAVNSEYYLGSVHALSETGEIVIASNTGSQLPHIVFTSPNVILVVSTKKITPTLDAAFKRLEEHVIPLEDEHMKGLYGTGTMHSKTVILRRENPIMKRNVLILFVKENLGF